MKNKEMWNEKVTLRNQKILRLGAVFTFVTDWVCGT